MVIFSHLYLGSIFYYAFCSITLLHILFSVVTRLDGPCRTQRSSQNWTVLAELDGSRRTRRFLQNSTFLAELDSFCRTRSILQNSTVLTELNQYRSQNSTVLAELDGTYRTRQVLLFHHPFARYGASYNRSATVDRDSLMLIRIEQL